MNAISTRNLTKVYGKDVRAVDGVTLTLAADTIHGLVGRNGSGKTTLMQLLAGQVFRTGGEISVLGQDPVENARVLSRMCFIQESQRYPDDFEPRHVFGVAERFYPNWDGAFAADLVEEFELPTRTRMKKLSRGQLSAVGAILGLASRAEITFFDEPYLGLDVVARQTFYDRLLSDYAANPRTILFSTHHLDEVENLLEHVVIIDRGQVLVDTDADLIGDIALTLTGATDAVSRLTIGHEVLSTRSLGPVTTATIRGGLSEHQRQSAAELGVDTEPVSLPDLLINLTKTGASS